MGWIPLERLRLAAATALGVAVLAAAWSMIPDREVVYSQQVTTIGCRAPEKAPCFLWARLSIGNTGNVDQEVVRVRLPGAAQAWRVDTRSSDIWASLVARAEPRVIRLARDDAAIYEIRPLSRNKVVDFNAYCVPCAAEAAHRSEALQIAVESEGRLSEGDPRAVSLFAALGRLASLLVPF